MDVHPKDLNTSHYVCPRGEFLFSFDFVAVALHHRDRVSRLSWLRNKLNKIHFCHCFGHRHAWRNNLFESFFQIFADFLEPGVEAGYSILLGLVPSFKKKKLDCLVKLVHNQRLSVSLEHDIVQRPDWS